MNRTLYILAGGESKRMGSNKAMLPIGESTFLEHLIAKSEQLFPDIIILSGSHHYPVANRQLVDIHPGNGPLGALETAAIDAGESEFAIITVDTPTISNRVLTELSQTTLAPGMLAHIARDGDHLHPLIGVYHSKCLIQIRSQLHSSDKSIHRFLKQIPTSFFSVKDHEVLNINRPEDLNLLP